MKIIILLLSTFAAGAASTAIVPPAEETPTAADRALDRVLGEDEKTTDSVPDRPDAWITGKVKSTLLFHKSVSELKTAVETSDGVVTLRGVADNQAQRDLATEYATEVEGVKHVNNLMQVKGERTMDARLDDATITAAVKGGLLSRRSTSALNTTVKSYDGVVTLGGSAKNEAEKELAEKIARGVKGVREVKNHMTIE